MLRILVVGLALLWAVKPVTGQTGAPSGQSAPTPQLTYVFSVRAEVAPPVEQGAIDGGRRRFVAITGSTVYGPKVTGAVLPVGVTGRR